MISAGDLIELVLVLVLEMKMSLRTLVLVIIVLISPYCMYLVPGGGSGD